MVEDKTANITFSALQNSYFTITQCQKNHADCVMNGKVGIL